MQSQMNAFEQLGQRQNKLMQFHANIQPIKIQIYRTL